MIYGIKLQLALFLFAVSTAHHQDNNKQCSYAKLPAQFIGTFELDPKLDEHYHEYLKAKGMNESVIRKVKVLSVTKVFRPARSGMQGRYDMEKFYFHRNVIYRDWALDEAFAVAAKDGTKYTAKFAIEGNALKESHQKEGSGEAEVITQIIEGDYLVTTSNYKGINAKRKYKRVTESCTTPLPEKFLGTFKLNSTKDRKYREQLTARGMPEALIDVLVKLPVSKVIREAESQKLGRYDLLELTPLKRASFLDWALREQFSAYHLSGIPFRVTLTLSHDKNKLTEDHVYMVTPFNKDVFEYTINGDDLVMMNTYRNLTTMKAVTAIRYYTKEKTADPDSSSADPAKARAP